jgi:HAD superfamily hydrolase (TIGR01549 family)
MTIPLQITTLLFDLDGTLAVQQPSSVDVLLSHLEQHQVPLQEGAFRSTMQFVYRYWANSDEAVEDLATYGDFTEAFWLQYLKRKIQAAGLSETQAADLAVILQPRIEEEAQPEKVVLEDVKPTLKALRTQGYAMGLVTNRSSSIAEEVEGMGFSPYFDFFYSAGDVNSWKPHAGIFEHALYLAESSPEEAAYIGDNYYTDIVGARNNGLYPILYDPRYVFPDADCQVITRISDLCSQM